MGTVHPRHAQAQAPRPDQDPRVRRSREAEERAEPDAMRREATADREAAVDEAIEMTFPASDPPAWMA